MGASGGGEARLRLCKEQCAVGLGSERGIKAIPLASFTALIHSI